MKKIFQILGIVFAGLSSGFAAFPPMQDMGPVKISTMIGISVSTTPRILLSTGFNMPLEPVTGGGTFRSSTWTINGQHMLGRISLEILNYSTNPVWIGYSAAVTSFPSVNMGRRIEASSYTFSGSVVPGSYLAPGSIWNYWIKSNDNINERSVLVIQNR